MATTLLRKLTRKSTLKFGQYHDQSIQELLNKKYHRYLRWVYYNCDMITFFEEILDEIGINPNNRIEKPGKYPLMNEALNELKSMKISGLTKYRIAKRNKKKDKMRSEKNIRKNNFSKGTLKNINHRHVFKE